MTSYVDHLLPPFLTLSWSPLLHRQAEGALDQLKKMTRNLPVSPKIVYLLVPTAANISSKPKDNAHPFLKPIRRSKILKFVVDLLHDNIATISALSTPRVAIPHKTLDQFNELEIEVFKTKNILIAEVISLSACLFGFLVGI